MAPGAVKQRRFIIADGAAETRAARLGARGVEALWFGPPPEAWSPADALFAGEEAHGRVKSINAALRAAFVDIGASRDAFLQLKGAAPAPFAEGALIRVRIVSSAHREKGATLRFVAAGDPGAPPGPIAPLRSPYEAALRALGASSGDGAIVESAPARAGAIAFLDGALSVIRRDGADLWDEEGGAAALASALSPSVAIAGGGRLHFDEARALAAIDVDTGAAHANSNARLRDKIARAAAREAATQIGLRRLSGRIVIDFPKIGERAGDNATFDFVRAALQGVDGVNAVRMDRSGLATLTRRRVGPSLLDEASEPAEGDLVEGRRRAADWLAREALWAAERRLRAQPQARVTLRVGTTIREAMTAYQQALERVDARYGARLEMAESETGGPRAYDIEER